MKNIHMEIVFIPNKVHIFANRKVKRYKSKAKLTFKK